MLSPMSRMPVVYLPHGGGPWPWMDMFDPAEMKPLASYLETLRTLPPERPRAVLAVSAHWEARIPTVMTSPHPPMLYDYYGFPPSTYEITWPAPGDPALAARVRGLLEASGFATAADDQRGFDHGTFVPLKLTYPDADIPTVQLSLLDDLDPARHLALGRALAPLRDEGVFLIGSGMPYHNMQTFRAVMRGGDTGPALADADAFATWLRATATAPAPERDRLLTDWANAPSARAAHPREEHLLPLMVIAGAAGDDRGTLAFDGTFGRVRLSAFHYG